MAPQPATKKQKTKKITPKPQSQKPNTLSVIPDDVFIVNILPYLHTVYLRKYRRVSQRFRNMIHDPQMAEYWLRGIYRDEIRERKMADIRPLLVEIDPKSQEPKQIEKFDYPEEQPLVNQLPFHVCVNFNVNNKNRPKLMEQCGLSLSSIYCLRNCLVFQMLNHTLTKCLRKKAIDSYKKIRSAEKKAKELSRFTKESRFHIAYHYIKSMNWLCNKHLSLINVYLFGFLIEDTGATNLDSSIYHAFFTHNTSVNRSKTWYTTIPVNHLHLHRSLYYPDTFATNQFELYKEQSMTTSTDFQVR